MFLPFYYYLVLDVGINDGMNVSITEGELDGNIEDNKDGLKDGEDEGNIVSKVYGVKDGIFEGWDEGTSYGWKYNLIENRTALNNGTSVSFSNACWYFYWLRNK